MTLRFNPISTAILIAVIGLLIFLAFKDGCNKPSLAIDKRQYDSVILANKELQKASGIVDSLVTVNNKRSVREDSLAKVTKKLGDQLEVKSLTAHALAVEVKLYEKYKDTVQMLRAAPLLADETIALSEEVESYKKVTEVLLDSVAETKQRFAAIIASKDSLYKAQQEQFNKMSANNSNCINDKAIIEKKMDNRNGLIKILGGTVAVLGIIVLAK